MSISWKIESVSADIIKAKYISLVEEVINRLGEEAMIHPKISAIHIVDDLWEEYKKLHDKEVYDLSPTREREYLACSKCVTIRSNDAEEVIIVIQAAMYPPERFKTLLAGQILYLHVMEMLPENIRFMHGAVKTSSFHDIIKMWINHWLCLNLQHRYEQLLGFIPFVTENELNIYVEEYKRKIRATLYEAMSENSLNPIFAFLPTIVGDFVSRCVEARIRSSSFVGLCEYEEDIKQLSQMLERNALDVVDGNEFQISEYHGPIESILEKSMIKLISYEPWGVKIQGNPKLIFKRDVIDTEMRIIVFMDILGFKEHIIEYEKDKYSNLLKDIKLALDGAISKTLIPMKQYYPDLSELLEYRMFSDNLCVSLPFYDNEDDYIASFVIVANVVRVYQLLLLKSGLLVRGGLAVGPYYSDSNMIFSKGLVSAYECEQKAIYPRVAISKEASKMLSRVDVGSLQRHGIDRMIVMDNVDRSYFITPFNIASVLNDSLVKSENDFRSQISAISADVERLMQPLFDVALNSFAQLRELFERQDIADYYDLTKYMQIVEGLHAKAMACKKESKVLNKTRWLRSLIDWHMNHCQDHEQFSYFRE